MDYTRSGIVYHGSDNTLAYLPLEELRAKVQILDGEPSTLPPRGCAPYLHSSLPPVSSRVILTQVYSNDADLPTRRAKYMFPVPAGAAIAGFELKLSDGTQLIGECMERSKARQEYEHSLQSGRSAGLLDWVTDDIFTISVGSIPPRVTAEAKIAYISSLMDDDIVNSIRFALPTCVGRRYGTPPVDLLDATRPDTRTRIRITVDIQTSGVIHLVKTPGYDEWVTQERPYVNQRPSKRRATVKLRSPNYLEQQFIVIIQADKLDAPRCFAEMAEDGRRSTLALQLTLIPKYDLPSFPAQEFIFVVDRSGSMSGAPIEQAKKTASVFLRLLPKEGTLFNVFAFDNETTSVATSSFAYDSSSLVLAEQFISSIQSGGGTEIGKALDVALSSRRTDLPTSVFVLTDGEASHAVSLTEGCLIELTHLDRIKVFDLDGTLNVVKRRMPDPSSPQMQIFTLGIGANVSSAMCEAIAKAGRGIALFAPTAHGIIGQCRRLLRAGKAQFIENIKVDWGVPSRYLVSQVSAPTVRMPLDEVPAVQQSPPHILQLHADSRIYVYTIISLRRPYVPKTVSLTGRTSTNIGSISTTTSFKLEIPIKGVNIPTSQQNLHGLAAWKLIQDHQDGTAEVPLLTLGTTIEEQHKAAVIRLGEKYQIASKYTSFVAHDRTSRRSLNQPRPRAVATRARARSPSAENMLPGVLGAVQAMVSGLLFGASSGSAQRGNGFPGAFPASRTDSAGSIAQEEPSPSAEQSSEEEEEEQFDDGGVDDLSDMSADSFSTMSSLEELSDWSDWSAENVRPARRRLTRLARDIARSASPFRHLVSEGAPQEIQERLNTEREQQRRVESPVDPTPTISEEVYDVLGIADYDGSFKLDKAVGYVSPEVVSDQPSADESTWATAIFVAFLLNKLKPGDAKDLLAKSLEFLDAKEDGKQLLDRAKSLLQ